METDSEDLYIVIEGRGVPVLESETALDAELSVFRSLEHATKAAKRLSRVGSPSTVYKIIPASTVFTKQVTEVEVINHSV